MLELDMNELRLRSMGESDLKVVIEIDTKVSGQERTTYYERKMSDHLKKGSGISISLVAEYKKEVIGFIMGSLSKGEFGIPETIAFLDSIGIDPLFQKKGVGNMLLDEFETNLKVLGVRRIQTLVDWDHWGLVSFFSATGFSPSPTLNLDKKI